jgi:5'-nucleotidase
MPTTPTRPAVRVLARVALALALAGTLAAAPVAAADAAPVQPAKPATVAVRVMSFNDLHGNLEPPSSSSGRVTLADGTTVDAGGAAYLATHVAQLRAAAANSVLLSTGDNIGASPLASALFHDEPTIDVLNQLGVSASVVGNHELDEGYTELKRIQFGGCHPTDGCQFEPTYGGAKFPFLGANITLKKNGLPAVLPFTVVVRAGVPIGVIGVTLKDLPDVVLPEGIKDLRFGDEVTAINQTSVLLEKLGVKSQVVLMHQGDETVVPNRGPDACNVADGADPARRIAKAARAQVDVVFAAHSHQQYNCVVTDPAGQPRAYIQGLSFGRLISTVDLTIDTKTRDVLRDKTVARNEIVTKTVTPDPAVQAIVSKAVTESAPIANRRVGSITADLVRAASASGEQPLGDVIADAQLAATTANGAQIAITNPGGIRADLTYASSPAGEGDGVVTYGEAFTVQPFANIMQTITLTGAQLDAVLEQQWSAGSTKILQISTGFGYTWSASGPIGDKVSNLRLNGTPVDPSASYRVSVNNFLAGGGDGFTVFTQGTNLSGGPIDLDAFTAYLTAHPNLSPPPSDRITLVP